ncbi:uncharacterized protein VTP21DRAFT_10397 [Calcarisporiella thermophila]|uniref:uncharacterized protein n=1 Tax=Calcarisporiella thermophila TaxID=911321 RepID=UPI0037432FE3
MKSPSIQNKMAMFPPARRSTKRTLLMLVIAVVILWHLFGVSKDDHRARKKPRITFQTQTPSAYSPGKLREQDWPPEVREAHALKDIRPTRSSSIPKIVHFIFGLQSPDAAFMLEYYLAVKSARDSIRPDKIYLHYHYPPKGEWFERARHMLTLRYIDVPTEVFGRPVLHYAERADLARLSVLMEFGGIYLDLDVISLRGFDDLLNYTFVMGRDAAGDGGGLGNSVILARPDAAYLQRWYVTYKYFDQSRWNYHSAELPGILSREFPDEITVLPHNAFYWPLWDKNGLRQLYLEKSYGFEPNYAVHMWESAARVNLLRGMTPAMIESVATSFFCEARRFLKYPDRAAPRDADCELLEKPRHPSGLVGHWPMVSPQIMNPSAALTPPITHLPDLSENRLVGLTSDGKFCHPRLNGTENCPAAAPDDRPLSSLYLDGVRSFAFLPAPLKLDGGELTATWWMYIPADVPTELNRVAFMIQGKGFKLALESRKARKSKKHPEGGMGFRVSVFPLGMNEVVARNRSDTVNDGVWHFFALTINPREKEILLVVDGAKASSLHTDALPTLQSDRTVSGFWIANAEPETTQYQDDWPQERSLRCFVRDMRIWAGAKSVQELNAMRRWGMPDYGDALAFRNLQGGTGDAAAGDKMVNEANPVSTEEKPLGNPAWETKDEAVSLDGAREGSLGEANSTAEDELEDPVEEEMGWVGAPISQEVNPDSEGFAHIDRVDDAEADKTTSTTESELEDSINDAILAENEVEEDEVERGSENSPSNQLEGASAYFNDKSSDDIDYHRDDEEPDVRDATHEDGSASHALDEAGELDLKELEEEVEDDGLTGDMTGKNILGGEVIEAGALANNEGDEEEGDEEGEEEGGDTSQSEFIAGELETVEDPVSDEDLD